MIVNPIIITNGETVLSATTAKDTDLRLGATAYSPDGKGNNNPITGKLPVIDTLPKPSIAVANFPNKNKCRISAEVALENKDDAIYVGSLYSSEVQDVGTVSSVASSHGIDLDKLIIPGQENKGVLIPQDFTNYQGLAYVDKSIFVAGDPNLASDKIKKGFSIFGVKGTCGGGYQDQHSQDSEILDRHEAIRITFPEAILGEIKRVILCEFDRDIDSRTIANLSIDKANSPGTNSFAIIGRASADTETLKRVPFNSENAIEIKKNGPLVTLTIVKSGVLGEYWFNGKYDCFAISETI